uniref:Uncharacterized protein n=1 Tax=Cannabis sativa TaxID=3483 RepID=A0A803PQ84_CANSA
MRDVARKIVRRCGNEDAIDFLDCIARVLPKDMFDFFALMWQYWRGGLKSFGEGYCSTSLVVAKLGRPPELTSEWDFFCQLIMEFGIIDVSFKSRSLNEVGNFIAKDVLCCKTFDFWDGDVPLMAIFAVLEDLPLLM